MGSTPSMSNRRAASVVGGVSPGPGGRTREEAEDAPRAEVAVAPGARAVWRPQLSVPPWWPAAGSLGLFKAPEKMSRCRRSLETEVTGAEAEGVPSCSHRPVQASADQLGSRGIGKGSPRVTPSADGLQEVKFNRSQGGLWSKQGPDPRGRCWVSWTWVSRSIASGKDAAQRGRGAAREGVLQGGRAGGAAHTHRP